MNQQRWEKVWARRKERMATDPEFAARVRRDSREGQRRRRARLNAGLGPPCPFVAKNGNRCWREGDHRHRS